MILVTGAAGFIGRHVVRRLTARCGASEVRALVHRSGTPFMAEFPDIATAPGSLTDPNAMAAAVRGAAAIIHIASKTVDRDGSGFDRVNVEGTKNLCEAAAGAGVPRFVHVSTTGVYGHDSHRDSDETTPVRPDTAYSRSKAAAEDIVLAHHRRGEFAGVVARYRFSYGDGDESFLPRVIAAARRIPFMVGGGRARLSVVAAEDLADALIRFAIDSIQREPEPIYHVTDGVPITFREMIEVISEAFGYPRSRFNVPFSAVYAPVRLFERLLSLDPEAAEWPLTSIRLRLVGQDCFFSSAKLSGRFPGLRFRTFREGFGQAIGHYSKFR